MFKLSRRWNRSILSRIGVAVVSLALAVMSAGPAMAQGKIDEDTEMDARLFGYETNVGIEKDSTTPLWFVYFFLVVVGLVGMFKTAKRE